MSNLSMPMIPQTPRSGSESWEEPGGPLSLWLYLAGLSVTLAGLFAVNFGLNDPNFSLLTYSLAIAGYALSYGARLRGQSLRSLHVPLLIGLAVLIFALGSSGNGLDWLMPSEAADRNHSLQLVFVWIAILHSFALSSNAAVLFACVPCMTMIALSSTVNTDPVVQNAFLVFVAATTFLMVHENYLRTQGQVRRSVAMPPVRGGGLPEPRHEGRLFGGQLQVVALCVAGAMLVANIVAVPMRTIGQAFVIATPFATQSTPSQSIQRALTQNKSMNDSLRVQIAPGPQAESDVPFLKVTAERGMYWRGSTFDQYDGRTFRNSLEEAERVNLPATPEGDRPLEEMQRSQEFGTLAREVGSSVVRVTGSNALELDPLERPHSEKMTQTFEILGGTSDQIYGAGTVEEVRGVPTGLEYSKNGKLTSSTTFTAGMRYNVVSRVPVEDPDVLRKAASKGDKPPLQVRRLYLQGANSTVLRDIALRVTASASSDYDRVTALREFVSDTCKYNLQAPASPPGRDVVEWFLTESKQGYCDAFAAAMVMLCRHVGIPARMASGFLAGDLDLKDNTYIVRERHKHLWAEVFFPGAGWVPFDATEGAVDISDRSDKSGARKGFFNWLMSRGWVGPTVLLVFTGLLGYVLKTEVLDRLKFRRAEQVARLLERPATNREIVTLYANACALLARRGLARGSAMTPNEYAAQVTARLGTILPEATRALQQLTSLCVRYRYGAETAPEEDARAARQAHTELMQALKQAKRSEVTR